MELTEIDGLGEKCGLVSLVLDSQPFMSIRFIRGVTNYETRRQDTSFCRNRRRCCRSFLFLFKIERRDKPPFCDFWAAIAWMWAGHGLPRNREIAVP